MAAKKKPRARSPSSVTDDAFDRALPGIVKAAFSGLRAQRRALDAQISRRIREETERALKETPWASFVPRSI